MFERITPNATTSYEQNLVEYAGYVYKNGSNLVASASPAVQVSHSGAPNSGEFVLTCLDELPIYSQINNNPYTVGGVPAQGMGAIAAGFASTCICTVHAVESVAPPYTGVTTAVVSLPQLSAPGRVFFNVKTFLNGIAADTGFTFKILVTGQMDQQVNGIGA